MVGRERTLGCVITIGAGMYDPGHCMRTDTRTLGFKVGELDGSDSDRARDIAALMNHVAGAESTTNLWGERWGKLAVNCMANPIAGLSGYGSGEVRARDDTRWLCIRIAAEVVQVGRAYGHHIDGVWGIDSQKFVDVANGGDSTELDAELIAGAQALGAGRPSFLQDVIRGRRVEIDALNGWVVEQGKAVEVATPVNQSGRRSGEEFPGRGVAVGPGESRSDHGSVGLGFPGRSRRFLDCADSLKCRGVSSLCCSGGGSHSLSPN